MPVQHNMILRKTYRCTMVQHTILIYVNKMPDWLLIILVCPSILFGMYMTLESYLTSLCLSVFCLVSLYNRDGLTEHLSDLLCGWIRFHSSKHSDWKMVSRFYRIRSSFTSRCELFVIYSNRLITILRESELILPSIPLTPAFSLSISNTFVY